MLTRYKSEMDRLDITHCMMVKGIGEKLYLTPLEKDKVHRILDIGTGTGICMYFEICLTSLTYITQGQSLWATSSPMLQYVVLLNIDTNLALKL